MFEKWFEKPDMLPHCRICYHGRPKRSVSMYFRITMSCPDIEGFLAERDQR